MNSVLAAEAAVLADLKSVGIVLFVFHCVIVALFAFTARECNFDSHITCPFLSSRYLPVKAAVCLTPAVIPPKK